MVTNQDFINELKAEIGKKHLLNHPFYRHWTMGTLPIAVMRRYAEQYYHLEKNFPKFLSRMHTECDDLVTRQMILENLYDEEHGDANHRELWLRFGEAIGASRPDIEQAVPLPETTVAVDTFNRLAGTSTLSGAAALAAYESQIPAVATSKIEGLQKHYGITEERGTTFFRVHSVLDIAHADAWWQAIDARAHETGVRAEAKAALIAARDVLWGFLDGVMRAYMPEDPSVIACS